MADVLDRARRLGHEVFAPIAAQGEPGRLNRPLVRALGEHGLLELVFAGSAVELCELREGLAHGCTEAETALALQGLGGYPILSRGSPAVRDEWIPRLSSGEVGRRLRAQRARRRLGRGQPRSAGQARPRRLPPDRHEALDLERARGGRLQRLRAHLRRAVRRGSPPSPSRARATGLSGEHLDLLAPHPIGRLDFDGVRVEADQVLGELDGGFAVAMDTLDLFRPSVGAFAVGMAQAALDAAVEHTQEREAFGKPLSHFQAVSHQLAEVATEIQAARLLVRDAATQYDAGVRPVRKASAMAKLFATEAAQRAVDVAIQVHGARAPREGPPARAPLS